MLNIVQTIFDYIFQNILITEDYNYAIAPIILSLIGSLASEGMKGSSVNNNLSISPNSNNKQNYSQSTESNQENIMSGLLNNFLQRKIGGTSAKTDFKPSDNSNPFGSRTASFKGLNQSFAKGGYYAKGGLTTFNGPKHEQGGIPLGKDEVEGGETSIDVKNSKYIFPDKKFPFVPGTKKTFAGVSKTIDKKYSLRDNDKIANTAKQRELENLQSVHQELKTAMDEKAILNFEKKNPGLLAKVIQNASKNQPQGNEEQPVEQPQEGQQFAVGGGLGRFWNRANDPMNIFGKRTNDTTLKDIKGNIDNYTPETNNWVDTKGEDVTLEGVGEMKGNYAPDDFRSRIQGYNAQGYKADQAQAEKINLGDIGTIKQKAFNREDNTEELKQYDDAAQRGSQIALNDPTSGNSTIAAMAAGAVGAKNKALSMADFNNRQAQRMDQYNQVGYGLQGQNIQNKLSGMSTNAQLGTQTNLANMGARNQASQFTSSALNDAAQFNATSKNAAETEYAKSKNESQMYNLERGDKYLFKNKDILNQSKLFNADTKNDFTKFNAQGKFGANEANIARREAKWNAQNNMQMEQYKDDNKFLNKVNIFKGLF